MPINSTLIAFLAFIAAYLLGSIPFGLLLGKKQGVDVRGLGSGNIGASNVARTLGKKLGALVLLLDACKAALPTLLAKYLWNSGTLDIFIVALVALGAVLGHCYPIWLRFRGGKGVATSLGVFLVIDPALTAIAIALFISIYALKKMTSLGSISAAISFPILMFVFGRPNIFIALGIIVALIIVTKHRENIKRLLQGEENRL